MGVIWLEKGNLFPVVLQHLKNVDIVLDIGCGIRPQKYVRPLVHICCEPFDQYVKHLQEKIENEYDRTYVIIKATWEEAVRFFPPKSVDTIFLVDVIEHLEKDKAIKLLKATEIIARWQVAVFTPLGYLPQHSADGKDAWGLDGGIWQEHKSGWYPQDFDDSWEIYAAKEFHTIDNKNKPFKKSYGAIWAIKNLYTAPDEIKEKTSKKAKFREIVDLSIDIRGDIPLHFLITLMRLMLSVKNSEILKLLIKLVKKIH
jgi:hypothetical protein